MRLQPLISIFIQISKIVCAGEGGWTLQVQDNKDVLVSVPKGSPNMVSYMFSPEFGVQIPAECLEIQFGRTDEIVVEISWNAND